MSTPSLPLKARLAQVMPYFSDVRWAFIAAAFGAALSAATEPLLAAMMRPLLDSGFQNGGIPLWAVPVAIIGLFLVRGIGGFILNYALAWASNSVTLKMRRAMFSRLQDAHPSLFSQQSSSTLINTVVYEVQNGSTLLINALQTLVKDSFTSVALLVYLIWLNWQLTLFIAVLLPAVAVTMRLFSRRMHRITVAVQNATDELAYVVEENTMAWRIVRLHNAAEKQQTRFEGVSAKLRHLALKATVAASTVTPITQLLSATALSAVIVVALWQAGQSGGGTVGSFVSFVTAMLMLITPLKHLTEVAGPVTRGLAALQRGIHLIENTPIEKGGDHAPARTTGHLQLADVGLRYRDDQSALDGVTLDIQPGQTVALVGPSGAGKTTLVNLLPRFLDPTCGSIRLDGVALQDWDLETLRKQFALVSQDVVLFNDSIAANVAQGAQIDEQRVREALKGANLLEFAEKLPEGIHSTVGHNGTQLSGGQRQRLAIARAIYKDAPILILDEATSALDSESERLVQSALDLLMKGRTSIVIAHRLSTVESADRVVVLDAGRVAEQGTHAELLAHNGLFARLHALQFKSA